MTSWMEFWKRLLKPGSRKNSLKTAEKKAKYLAGEVVASYEDWKKKFPHRTKPALMGHGKDILLPVGRYYHNQFTNKYGDCNQMREML